MSFWIEAVNNKENYLCCCIDGGIWVIQEIHINTAVTSIYGERSSGRKRRREGREGERWKKKTWVDFTNELCAAFTPWRSQKRKKTVKSSASLRIFGIYVHKSIKAASKHRRIRHQCSISSTSYVKLLMPADPKSVKRYWWLDCIFYTLGIYKRKSCV